MIENFLDSFWYSYCLWPALIIAAFPGYLLLAPLLNRFISWRFRRRWQRDRTGDQKRKERKERGDCGLW